MNLPFIQFRRKRICCQQPVTVGHSSSWEFRDLWSSVWGGPPHRVRWWFWINIGYRKIPWLIRLIYQIYIYIYICIYDKFLRAENGTLSGILILRDKAISEKLWQWRMLQMCQATRRAVVATWRQDHLESSCFSGTIEEGRCGLLHWSAQGRSGKTSWVWKQGWQKHNLWPMISVSR